MACSADNSNDLIIFLLEPAFSLFAGAVAYTLIDSSLNQWRSRSAAFDSVKRRGLKSCQGNVAQPANHHDSFRPVVAAKQLCRSMRHDGGGGGGLLSDICPSAGHCDGRN